MVLMFPLKHRTLQWIDNESHIGFTNEESMPTGEDVQHTKKFFMYIFLKVITDKGIWKKCKKAKHFPQSGGIRILEPTV